MVAHLLHMPPPLAARGLTRRRKKIQASRGSKTTSSLLPFFIGGDLQNTKKRNKQLNLAFLSLSSDILLSFFRSAKSRVGLCYTRRRQTRHVDGWIGNFPPPTLFLLRRCRPPLPWLGDRHPWSLGFLLLLYYPSASLLISPSFLQWAAISNGEEGWVKGENWWGCSRLKEGDRRFVAEGCEKRAICEGELLRLGCS